MPITVPTDDTEISASLFGAPVANALNAMYPSELMFSQVTTNFTVTATTAAGAQTVINPGNIVYDGTPIIVEFFCAGVQISQQILLHLWDANTDLGYWGVTVNPAAASSAIVMPQYLRRRIVPSAGTHNYNLRAWQVPGPTSAVLNAGAGGVGVYAPMYLRASRA